MKRKPVVISAGRQSFFTPLGVERGLLACYAGLSKITLLATSDAPAGLGMFVVQSFLWTLLACGLAAFYIWRPERAARWDTLDTVVCSWLVWTAISTVAVLGIGDMRAAVNGFWQSVAFGLVILLGRRLLNAPERRSGMITLLIGLSLLLAMHGLYQYAILTPETILRIEADPQAFLKQAGIAGELDSPEAQTFLNRAKSTEPLAAFALTNSLAGCLLPAMVLLVCSLEAQRRAGSRLPYSTVFIWLTIFLLLSLCLLLTKSRTAMLALLAGGVIVALRSWRIDWRWLAGGAAVLALLLVLMFASGIWDREVLSEAPKSVLYRLEYWYSTLGMIRDHWLLGVGLGNFQSVYTQYMLPQASEEIADPHNFLLEIAATTGLPGLLLFLSMLFLLGRAGSLLPESNSAENATSITTPTPFRQAGACPTKQGETRWLLLGGIGGLLLTPMVMQVGEAGVDTFLGLPIFWSLGIPMLCAIFWWSGRTNFFTTITPSQLLLALAVLFINLLAAGGINFPNVAILLALLAAMLTSREVVREETHSIQLSTRFAPFIGFLLLYTLAAGCYWSCYSMVLGARRLMQESHQLEVQKQYNRSWQSFQQALQIDPWDRSLPEFRIDLEQPLFDDQIGIPTLYQDLIQRDQRRSKSYEQLGDIAFQVYPQNNNAYSQAVQLQPNSALLHAKLAWYHFNVAKYQYDRSTEQTTITYRGDIPLAITEAKKSLELDQLMPHHEKKLSSLKLSPYHLGRYFSERYEPDNLPNYEEAMQLILKLAPNRPHQETQ